MGRVVSVGVLINDQKNKVSKKSTSPCSPKLQLGVRRLESKVTVSQSKKTV
jgi:hypothetical protein